MKPYKLTYVYEIYPDSKCIDYIAAPSVDHVVHYFNRRSLNDSYIEKIELISDYIEIIK